ncbi:MAG: diiron oxygenase [Actinobacteria bacterium]|nr:diiron oxygenase [Actinomycetota bacterium]
MRTYVSAFSNWHTRAWVRSKPHHTGSRFEPGYDFFPADLAMTMGLPEVGAIPGDIRSDLLVYELYGYLRFTTLLEVNLVSSVCKRLVRRTDIVGLDPLMRRDLLMAFADEAGHAEMCEEMILAVEEETGLRPIEPVSQPAFIRALRLLSARCPIPDRSLVPLLAAVVSETLLSPVIVNLPTDEAVHPEVRALVRDHAADEVRHSALFRVVFRHLWHSWPSYVRRVVLELLPDVIDALLTPDKAWLREVLARYPDVFDDPDELAHALSGAHMTALLERPTLAPVMGLLDELDALDTAEATEIFLVRGLSPVRMARR